METILEKIELVRKEKGIKQTVLAEMLGVKQSTYNNYVKRNEDITFSRLSQIANKLGVEVIYIITYPVKYVPEEQSCKSCKMKDEAIENLNDYIRLLKKKG